MDARRNATVRRQPERLEQEAVKRLLLALGAKFWVAGTVRKRGDHPGTMQTPGLPDIPLCFLPTHRRSTAMRYEPAWVLVLIEVKSPAAHKAAGGGLRHEQRLLRELCREADVAYVHGDLDAIIGWLIDNGFLKPENVPHYRRPATKV